MADGRISLSPAGRDSQPAGRPVEYLRALLVAHGALPARNEPLARLERRVAQLLSRHHRYRRPPDGHRLRQPRA